MSRSTRVNVITYDRPWRCRLLLEDIAREQPDGLSIRVFDDCSTADYSRVREMVHKLGGAFDQAPQHRGKAEFWQLIACVHLMSRASGADWIITLQDDVRLCSRFFDRVWKIWDQLPNDRVVLNLIRDKRDTCWTRTKPVDVGEARRVGWVDGVALAFNYRFLTLIPTTPPPAGWRSTPGKSSGVYMEISRALEKQHVSMYQVKSSLVVHAGNSDSVMHPDERQRTPIYAGEFIDGPEEHDRLCRE